MELISHLNNLDYILLAIIALSILFGLWRGFLVELFALLVWSLSFFIAIHYSVEVGHLIVRGTGDTQSAGLFGFLAVIIVLLIFGSIVRMLFSAVVGGKGPIGRLIGGVFGFLRGCVISFVIVFVCLHSNWRSADWFTSSALAPHFKQANVWLINNVLKYKKDHWYFNIKNKEALKRNKTKVTDTVTTS